MEGLRLCGDTVDVRAWVWDGAPGQRLPRPHEVTGVADYGAALAAAVELLEAESAREGGLGPRAEILALLAGHGLAVPRPKGRGVST